PSDQRYSIAIVRPSTQSSSRMRATKAAAHGAKPAALAPRNPTIGSLPVCCADVVTGHVTAAPTISVMNSRRLICLPLARSWHRTGQTGRLEAVRSSPPGNVRFGPKAEMGQAPYLLILETLIPPPKHADHLLM